MRLGVKLGAQSETFMGLAGLGDLVLTCTDNQSRNRRFGLAIASGQSVQKAQQDIGQVVEGLHGARAVHQLAAQHGIDMPICEVIYRVLYERLSIKEAVEALMARELRPESD
jgi:glycerol-3-phosphate dehydrogenase (NAD(P)+)